MGARIEIRFGALAPRLKVQLKGYNIRPDCVKEAQSYADYITRLYLQSLLSEQETRAARNRLGQWIKERIQPS